MRAFDKCSIGNNIEQLMLLIIRNIPLKTIIGLQWVYIFLLVICLPFFVVLDFTLTLCILWYAIHPFKTLHF